MDAGITGLSLRASCVAATIALALLGTRAVAQAPQADTLQSDSASKTAASPIHPPVFPAIVMAAVAPPSLLLLRDKTPDAPVPTLGFLQDHVTAYVTGGVTYAFSSDTNTWAYSAGVQILRRRLYGEVRSEYFVLPQYYYYRTLRIGYFFSPRSDLAAGVTLGYRAARRVAGHSGVEIGLPFIAGHERRWLRVETAYVVSRRAPSWNFRWQAEWLINGGPLYVGMNIEGKTLPLRPGSKVSSVPIALVLGLR